MDIASCVGRLLTHSPGAGLDVFADGDVIGALIYLIWEECFAVALEEGAAL
jgi:hypothetical protein